MAVRGSPAKGVGWGNWREGSNPSFSAKIALHHQVRRYFSYNTFFIALRFLKRYKQRFTRGYKRYKETSGLTEWKIGHIFHSIFT